jgi:hypothetical protein
METIQAIVGFFGLAFCMGVVPAILIYFVVGDA